MPARRKRPPASPLIRDHADLPLFSGAPAEAVDSAYTPRRASDSPPAPELPGMPEHPPATVTVNGFDVPTAHAGAVRLGDRRAYVVHHAANRPLPPTIHADYTRPDRSFGGIAALAWLTVTQARKLAGHPGVWLVRVALGHETAPDAWAKES